MPLGAGRAQCFPATAGPGPGLGSHRGINAATLDTPQRRAAITSRNNALRCGAKRPQLNERQTQQKSRTQRFPFLAMFAFSAFPWAVDSENRFVHRE